MNLLVILSIITCVFTILTTVYSIANTNYPRGLVQGSKNLLLPTALYIFVTVAAAITLWETWKNNVAGSLVG
jgi:hypothetical protein